MEERMSHGHILIGLVFAMGLKIAMFAMGLNIAMFATGLEKIEGIKL